MQNICSYVQEIGRCANFSKILRLSSCGSRLCRVTFHEQNTAEVNRRFNITVGNSKALTTCVRYLHFEKRSRMTPNFTKRDVKQCHRYTTSDMPADTMKNTCETETESMEVESLVGKMVEDALNRDRMVVLVPKSVLNEHVKTLLDCGFSEADIVNLSKYPEIIKNLSQVVDVICLLMDYGLNKKDITNVLNKYPKIVLETASDVEAKLKLLLCHGFKFASLAKIITKHPDLLGEDLSRVSQRMEELRLLFKTKDVFYFLEKSPNLFCCDFEYITQRFNYVYHEMGITQPQMVHSALFSYPMEHLHARHIFVVRAGFFKKLKKKVGQRDLNPRLDKILDTSDEKFVQMFGEMTVSDYQTFKKLLIRDRVILKNFEEYEDD